jgi:cation diffusion facilitator family transporter
MFSSKKGVAALSVASNTLLTVTKLIVGLMIGSVSVVAEAIHSGVDLLAAAIALFAVTRSARPPDDEYPFGRDKIENVSGTVEALLIFLAAGLIIFEAIDKLLRPPELPAVDLGLVVMGLSVVVNLGVSRRLFAVARRTDSVALEADAYHLTTDIVTSLGVFAGLVLVRLTGFAYLDPLAALAVAALIIKAAWEITCRSFLDLLDRGLPAAERRLVASIIQEHGDRLVGFHQVRTRKAGGERHVDLHLVVAARATVEEAHDLCDHLERDLHGALGRCSLNIHIEPCRLNCESCSLKCSISGQGDEPAA